MTTMTIPQLSSEIKRLFDESYAILAKTGGNITDDTSNEDRAKLTENKGLILAYEAERDQKQTDAGDTSWFAKGHDTYGTPAGTHEQPTGGGRSPFSRSIGHGLVASNEYDTARKHGRLNLSQPQLAVPVPQGVSMIEAAKSAGLMESKALLTSNDASGGSFVVNDRLAGFTPRVRGELAFLDVLPTIQTTSDTVEWVIQNPSVNNAAPVAEATATSGTSGAKPESAVSFQLANRGVEQIATWVPMTTRILNDAPMLRSAVDDELLYMLREQLETQCVVGNGATPQLLGINNWPNILTMAVGAASPADALFNASLAVRFTGGVTATVAVIPVSSFAALRLMRENAATATQGNYLFGPPNQPGPMTIFGMSVVTAQAVPANTAYVMNSTATTIALVEREGGTIETGWINDQFTRNLITLRAELRAALIVRRPAGICKVTGMP